MCVSNKPLYLHTLSPPLGPKNVTGPTMVEGAWYDTITLL